MHAPIAIQAVTTATGRRFTRNWRGKPLISHEVIIQLIAATYWYVLYRSFLLLGMHVTYTVLALSTGGRRIEKVENKIEGGDLVFTANIRGRDGARLLYKVVRGN